MKKLKVISAIVALSFTVSLAALSAQEPTPVTPPATNLNVQNTLTDIDTQLEQINEQESELSASKQQLQEQIDATKADRASQEKLINDLRLDLEANESRFIDVTNKFETARLDLVNTLAEVKEANERVRGRNIQNAAKLRFIYTQSSSLIVETFSMINNLGDFVTYMDFLSQVLKIDKDLSVRNNSDLQLASDKAKKYQEIFEVAKDYMAQSVSLRSNIQQSQILLGSALQNLNQKVQDLETASDAQEQALIELARKRSALFERKRGIQNSPYTANYDGSVFVWPVPQSHIISSPFHDPEDRGSPHKGYDIAAPKGSDIIAAQGGVVLIASWVSGYGNTVVIETGKGMQNWYGHIRDGGIMVKEGQVIKAGEKIAEVGSTGDSTGNHLHFEVRIGDKPVNPEPFLVSKSPGQPIVTNDLVGNTITVTPEPAVPVNGSTSKTSPPNPTTSNPPQTIQKPADINSSDNISQSAPKKK